MADAREIARLFIELGTIQASSDAGDGVTNLRLNKLLYFAQGYCLAKYNRPLFQEKIEAWDLGPVVPSVYHHYKGFRKNVIEDSAPQRDSFSDSEFNLVLDVYRFTKLFSTAKLVDMTHEPGSPWFEAYHAQKGGEIRQDAIRAYFKEKPIGSPSFDTAIEKLKAKAYTPARDKNGVAVIPKEIADGWSE